MVSPSMSNADLANAATQALNAGDAARARQAFEALTERAQNDLGAWLGLAYACRALGDMTAMLTAVEMALSIDPRNIRALIMKADDLSARGEDRAAAGEYRAALRQVQPNMQIPPDLMRELHRAKTASDRYASQFESHLRGALQSAGLGDDTKGARVEEALDILLGKKQAYVSAPLNFYFPELASVQFWERAQFDWLPEIEAASDIIRKELLGVLGDESVFTPYVEADTSPKDRDHGGLLGSSDWSAFFLVKNGSPIEENIARCPKTYEVISKAPLANIPNNSPSILFSKLTPRTRIPPHTGRMNTRLICHLPMIIPSDCAIRVGNHTRPWTMGEALVFDDSIEHEAWNDSDETRVVLIFDVWRPDLSSFEREMISSVFQAIDAYSA